MIRKYEFFGGSAIYTVNLGFVRFNIERNKITYIKWRWQK